MLELDVDVRSFGDINVMEHVVLENEDIKAVNTKSNPDNVVPHNRGTAKVDGGHVKAMLTKASWNVIRLRIKND
jgi:alpha-N-arabinofuranosidase